MNPQLLGSLETAIMQFFWKNPTFSSISDLHQHLNKKESLAYTTVSTIVGRLVEKRLLTRQKAGRGYTYRATQSEEEFRKSTSRRLIKNILGNFGDVAIVGFLEELQTNPEALQKLKELSRG
jgi:predicted transcriptional regulator